MAEDEPEESSKTEDATPKKLEDARERGQVAQSRELNTWMTMLAVTLIIGLMTPSLFLGFTDFLRVYLEQADKMGGGGGDLAAMLSETFWTTLGFIILPFLVMMFFAFIGPFMQFGFLFAPETIKPDWGKVSIIKGFGRLFSLRSVIDFIKGLLKLAAVSVVAFALIYPYFGQVEETIGMAFPDLMDKMLSLTLRMMGGILVVLLVIAIADVLYQRWEFMKKMRMTKQEIKDEFKQTEGDPYVKGRLKQLRMERARQRMMQAVPQADVVITNPTHFAIALKYNPAEMEAPMVIAKGIDEVALRIRAVATEHNIEIVENPPLARTLYDVVELDSPIPADLYKAVAEIISFVFKKKGKTKR